MKKLVTSDLFAALRIIKAANLRDELKPIIQKAAQKGAKIEDIGIEGILAVIESMAEKKAENALYEFLAKPFEMQPQEVADLEISQMMEKLSALAKENDLKVFFERVSSLIT